jgi:hypothetical protein
LDSGAPERTRDRRSPDIRTTLDRSLGPDGALYVSNFGFGPPPIGLGTILRIVLE